MKKLLILIMALVMILSLAACGQDKAPANPTAQASPPTNPTAPINPSNSGTNAAGTIFIDLEEVATDVPSQFISGTLMVPVQAVVEHIGYDVNWDEAEQRLEIWEPSRQHPTLIMTIGNTTAYFEKYDAEIDERLSGEATLASQPVLFNEKVFAPLSFIADALGYTVDDNVDSEDIYLFSPYYMENQIGEGIGEDREGIGEDGEGIGTSQPVTEDEMNYVLSLRTENWLALEQERKEKAVSIIARWWDVVDGYVVEDFDEMLAVLDKQMSDYSRNGVDEGVLETACDIYGIDISNYITV